MMRYRYLFPVLIAVIISAIGLIMPQPAAEAQSGATLTVTTLVDEDVNPGTGCSLREAMTAANTNANYGGCSAIGTYGNDIINISVVGMLDLSSPLPLMSSPMTISGSSPNSVIVRRNSAGDYSIFAIPIGVTATISGLAIVNGTGTLFDGSTRTGGGIFNNGTLTLSNSIVSNNLLVGENDKGAGIYNGGTLTVTNTDFGSNFATGTYGSGGGIYNAGTLTITNSTFSGNSARGAGFGQGGGGGIYTAAGTVTITDTIFTQNIGGFGGGIYKLAGTMTVSNSTFSANRSTAAYGGGIHNRGGALTITNTTLSANIANSNGGAIENRGTLTVVNSTIANNTDTYGLSGGVYADSRGVSVTFRNTIVSGNRLGPGSTVNCGGTIINGGANLANDSSCGFGSGNNVDPLLLPLADNGNGHETHALQVGSPAIDTGSNGLAVDAAGNLLRTDQRGVGFPRFLGSGVDVGAFESYTPGSDLILNGTFSVPVTTPNPPLFWVVYGLPNLPPWSVTSGVFSFHRAVGSSQAVVFQNTYKAFADASTLESQFSLGNSSSVRKRVLLLIHDADFSDSSACTFWLPPNSPLRSYAMRLHTTEDWTNATISIYASNPADGLAALQVDNVSLRQVTGAPLQGTLCTDPGVPAPPGGADGANLLDNSDFALPLNPTSALDAWSSFNQINAQIVGGVAQLHRVGTPRGNLFQEDLTVTNAGMPLEVTLQMGNSENRRMRVVVLIHKRNFADLAVCAFWLAPNTPLGTYTLRTVATMDWTDGTALSIYPDTLYTNPVPAGRVLVDNVTLRQRPGLDVARTECYLPGAALPSEALALVDAPKGDNTPNTGAVPGVEPPLIATPVPLLPASEVDGEGEFTEGE